MGWFQGLKSKQIVPEWLYTTTGVCWRLLPTRSGLFVGEDRDSSAKTVSFFCIDRFTGKQAWNNVRFKEQWWIGIETIHNNVVFMHEYAVPDMPDHKGIYAVDILSGKVLWVNDTVKFLFAYNDTVYAVQDLFDRRKFFELDLETGNQIGEVDAGAVDVIRGMLPTNSYDFINYPTLFRQEDLSASGVEQGITKALNKTHNSTHIEYIVEGDKLVVSYYDNSGVDPMKASLQQHLAIVSRERDSVLYRDVVNGKAIASVADTFFNIGETLYYIREKSTIVAINLSNSVMPHGKN